MKKILLKITLTLLMVGLFFVSIKMYQSFKLEPKADIVVSVSLYEGSNLLLEVSLESKENETVEDLIRRCFILSGTSQSGYYIKSIGYDDILIKEDRTHYIGFYVNDDYQNQGVSMTYLNDKDRISFVLMAL